MTPENANEIQSFRGLEMKSVTVEILLPDDLASFETWQRGYNEMIADYERIRQNPNLTNKDKITTSNQLKSDFIQKTLTEIPVNLEVWLDPEDPDHTLENNTPLINVIRSLLGDHGSLNMYLLKQALDKNANAPIPILYTHGMTGSSRNQRPEDWYIKLNDEDGSQVRIQEWLDYHKFRSDISAILISACNWGVEDRQEFRGQKDKNKHYGTSGYEPYELDTSGSKVPIIYSGDALFAIPQRQEAFKTRVYIPDDF